MSVIILQRKCLLTISKWRKVKTWTTLSTFLRFCDMTLQKNVFSNYVDGRWDRRHAIARPRFAL